MIHLIIIVTLSNVHHHHHHHPAYAEKSLFVSGLVAVSPPSIRTRSRHIVFPSSSYSPSYSRRRTRSWGILLGNDNHNAADADDDDNDNADEMEPDTSFTTSTSPLPPPPSSLSSRARMKLFDSNKMRRRRRRRRGSTSTQNQQPTSFNDNDIPSFTSSFNERQVVVGPPNTSTTTTAKKSSSSSSSSSSQSSSRSIYSTEDNAHYWNQVVADDDILLSSSSSSSSSSSPPSILQEYDPTIITPSSSSSLLLADFAIEDIIPSSSLSSSSSSIIEGVLPVSELFYRSSYYNTNYNYDVMTRDDDDENETVKKEKEDEEHLADTASISSSSLPIPPPPTSSSSSSSSQLLEGGDGMIFTDDPPPPSEAVQRELTNMANQEVEEQRRFEFWIQQQQQKQQQEGRSASKDDSSSNSRSSSSTSTTTNSSNNKSRTNNNPSHLRKKRSGYRSEEEFGESVVAAAKDGISTKNVSSSSSSRGRKSSKTNPSSNNNNSKSSRSSSSHSERHSHSHRTIVEQQRKLVRRGMEMLVGGEPINADPPQRSIELNYYRKHPKLWARCITTNAPEFGPLLHMHSAAKVGKESIYLYCENFVEATMKWGVCPKDLKEIVSEFGMRRRNDVSVSPASAAEEVRGGDGNSVDMEWRGQGGGGGGGGNRVVSISDNDLEALRQGIIASSMVSSSSSIASYTKSSDKRSDDEDSGSSSLGQSTTTITSRELEAPKGFGIVEKQGTKKGKDGRRPVHTRVSSSDPSQEWRKGNDDHDGDDGGDKNSLTFTLGGELKFSLGVSRTDIENDHEDEDTNKYDAFHRVLRNGISHSIHADTLGFDVHIADLIIEEVDVKKEEEDDEVEEAKSIDIVVQFHLLPREGAMMGMSDAKKAAKEVNDSLSIAMEDGTLVMALASATRDEKGWSIEIRNRIVEEFLLEIEANKDAELSRNDNIDEDVGDGDEDQATIIDYVKNPDDDEINDPELDSLIFDDRYDGPFGMEDSVLYAKDDMWLGGGNGGVFFDYSESNYMNSPYKGKLGPYLVDAVVERARQNQPRVIAIGDVHGCIDELKALLRKCDYHPGDLIVFLGDLVCKGPDSLSVVQMAREVGALGVRGNHDFEVVRWHQAIKSGADPPVIGSEHYYVASALSTADLKWMYSLPWFISSSQLNSLFVHAGFVSGIRLAKQNPRLMMNMRSILPDGTVTSKFFNNWPWARLWDGPQTILFGHDADRGLQQYEHAIGLDTGCVYGGKLTACILPEKRLVSVNAKQEYFQYRRKHFD